MTQKHKFLQLREEVANGHPLVEAAAVCTRGSDLAVLQRWELVPLQQEGFQSDLGKSFQLLRVRFC